MKSIKTDKTNLEQKFETKTTDEDHDEMHGNIKNKNRLSINLIKFY